MERKNFNRYYFITDKSFILKFENDYEKHILMFPTVSRKELFTLYVNRYNALLRMTYDEMFSEINRLIRINLVKLCPNIYPSVENIPLNLDEVNDIYRVEARDVATMSIYEDLSRVCVVKSLESDETIDTAMLHEPFRASMNPQQHILYKWICLCPTSLDVGFCAHVFFVEHHDHNNTGNATPIPESVQVRSLVTMNSDNHSFRRRGRPRSVLMTGALSAQPPNNNQINEASV